jgi:uncharacterized damage-inducible protein DinB
MNKEIQSIIRNLRNINSGTPWYGRPVYELLEETDPPKAAVRPNGSGHSMLELLYHMLTWAEFTLQSIEGKITNMTDIEKMDWREIDPAIHSWQKGVAEFKSVHEKITGLLEEKDDAFLGEKVEHREYKFRFLLYGLLQHNIYHIGQIAYVNKFLV